MTVDPNILKVSSNYSTKKSLDSPHAGGPWIPPTQLAHQRQLNKDGQGETLLRPGEWLTNQNSGICLISFLTSPHFLIMCCNYLFCSLPTISPKLEGWLDLMPEFSFSFPNYKSDATQNPASLETLRSSDPLSEGPLPRTASQRHSGTPGLGALLFPCPQESQGGTTNTEYTFIGFLLCENILRAQQLLATHGQASSGLQKLVWHRLPLRRT